MEKPTNPKWDNVKATLWFIAMLEVFILCLAIINGHVCGHRNSLIGFGIFGLIIGGVLLAVVIAVVALDLLLGVVTKQLRDRVKKNDEAGQGT